MNERKEESQNPKWDPGKPSVANIAQVHCNLHTLCNAKSRRGRDAFKITFSGIKVSLHSYDSFSPSQVMVGIWDIKSCRKRGWDKGKRLLPGGAVRTYWDMCMKETI